MDEQKENNNEYYVRDVVDNLVASTIVTKSSLTTKRRISFILVDNAMEIALRNYLKMVLKDKSELSKLQDVKFPTLLEEVQRKVPNVIDDKIFVQIKDYHVVRSKFYHVLLPIDVSDNDLTKYYNLVSEITGKLFNIEMTQITESSYKKSQSQKSQSVVWTILKPIKIECQLTSIYRNSLFNISFEIKNKYKEEMNFKIYVVSKTQSTIFVFHEREKIKRFLRIPVGKKRYTSALDDSCEQTIYSGEKEKFNFTCLFRPLMAYNELLGKLTIEYQIFYSGKKTKDNSGKKILEIPVEFI